MLNIEASWLVAWASGARIEAFVVLLSLQYPGEVSIASLLEEEGMPG